MTDAKNRHGCLTAWLVLMLLGNSVTAVSYLQAGGNIRQTLPNMPEWAIPVLIVASLFNVVCTIALFQWKKWGFWGFCATSIVALVVNLSIGLGIASALAGLLGVLLLYGVLQIGNENKGWVQLE